MREEDAMPMLRVPPHSIEAESSVLGGLLLDNRTWDRVGDLLTDTDFYRFEHRIIFASIAGMVNACKPADVMTVYAQLQTIGKADEVGGLAYLALLAQYVPSAGNIRRYAEIVRDRAVLRQLIAASDEIITSAFNTDGKPVDVILDAAMQKVLAISPESKDDEWVSMDKMVVRQLDLVQARANGESLDRAQTFTSTGLAELDELLDGGLRAGQMVVIGARPGMGKSAIADTIGIHFAMNERQAVGKFSMEMQNDEGGERALSAVGRIPLHALKRSERMSDEHWSSLTRGVETLRHIPFFSNEKGGLNINQVRAKARALHRRHRLGLLIVDYLQLMSGTDQRAPRTYQLEEASRGLKSLAKELQIPVIALAQVNRGVEKETDPMPRMSDLKDCGAIEQDADVILFLHRQIVTKPDLGVEWRHYAQAHLAKQRGGRTGKFPLTYIGENTRFANWPRDLEEPTSQVQTPQSRGMQ